jgi:hypothetical protein
MCVGKVRPCPLPCTWREVKCILGVFHVQYSTPIMGVLNGVGALAVQGFAIAHGLLTIFLAILYSLTRKDTWVKDKDDELRFKKGRGLLIKSNQSDDELIPFHAACKTLWSLSDSEADGDLPHKFLTLENGLQMHYISTADSSQSTDSLIIFLHGFPDSCYIWEQQLRSDLAKKAKLVALDLPACGGSDSHFRYGPDEILNAVAEAIVRLKDRYLSTPSTSPQKSVLVSHDWYVRESFDNSKCDR